MNINNYFNQNFIFNFYVPGSYGSILSLILEQSNNVDKLWDEFGNNFLENGSAHVKISNWVEKFHHGPDIDNWLMLSDEQKISYVEKRINSTPTNNIKIQRVTVPSGIPEFKRIFPESKFLYIKYTKEYENIVINNFVNKTMINDKLFEEGLYKKHRILYELLLKNPKSEKEKLKFLKKIALERANKIYLDNEPDYVKVVDIGVFFNWKDFWLMYNNLCGHFKIEVCDELSIKKLYVEFAKVNNINV